MNPVETILRGDARFAAYLADPGRYRLQVLLGEVENDAAGKLRLEQHGFRVDAEYFYPASTIKLCAAVAALEELTALAESTGLPIDERTPLVYHPLFADEVLESTDPSNLSGGKITVGHEIRKLFLVSDNTAFNRLYELIGQDGVNLSMHRAGLTTARIVHRLSEFRSVAENRLMPRIVFQGKSFRHERPQRESRGRLVQVPADGLAVGHAFLRDGERVDEPLDFSAKNRISLVDLQRALVKVVLPDVEVGGESFRLTERQRALLLEPMSQVPRQSKNPVYDPDETPDHYVKFLLPGLERVIAKERLQITNKIGQAYGFTIENAYVRDTVTGRGFFLSAVLYTNADGVLNDDQYEYEEEAEPFFADLGEAVARALWNLPKQAAREAEAK